MIESKEISVVYHGPIRIDTYKSIKKCRKLLPHAEIIFSTWEEEDVFILEKYVDHFIFSKDPGAYKQSKDGSLNNLNRQIRSSKEGVNVATKKYCLSLRSDMIIDNTGFIHCFDSYKKRNPSDSIFCRKILISELFTRISIKGLTVPFHISDWYFFGLTEDIKKVYSSIEEVEEPFYTEYFRSIKNINQKKYFGDMTVRYPPEQYIGYSIWKKYKGKEILKDCMSPTKKLDKESQKFIVNNFIVANYQKSGLYIEKYRHLRSGIALGEEWLEMYNQLEYLNLLSKYTDGRLLPRKRKLLEIIYIFTIPRIIRHYNKTLKKTGYKKIGASFEFILAVILTPIRSLKAMKYYLLKNERDKYENK